MQAAVGRLWAARLGWGENRNMGALSTENNWAVHIGDGDIHRHPQVCTQLLINTTGLGIGRLLLYAVGQFGHADED